MNKYSKEFIVTGTEKVVNGKIEVAFENYNKSPFMSVIATEPSNIRNGVKITCSINGEHFSIMFMTDYIPINNEPLLLENIDKEEKAMREQMRWIANGGQKTFELKMSERGFSVIEVTNEFTRNIINH